MRLQVSCPDASTLNSVVAWCVKNFTGIVDGWLVQHKDDGTHGTVTADSVTAQTVAATESLAVGRNAADTAALLTVAVNDSGPSPVVDITAPGSGNAINVYAASGILLQVPVSDATASAVFIGHAGITINSGLGDVELIKGQLNFPATQNPSTDAHTLDDYEEGVVTPLTSPDVVYTASALNYQKTGSYVHVIGAVTFPVTANANQALITNLPFTCENSNQARGAGVCGFDNSGLGTRFVVLNNSTTLQFFTKASVGQPNSALTGASLHFEFKYRATA